VRRTGPANRATMYVCMYVCTYIHTYVEGVGDKRMNIPMTLCTENLWGYRAWVGGFWVPNPRTLGGQGRSRNYAAGAAGGRGRGREASTWR